MAQAALIRVDTLSGPLNYAGLSAPLLYMGMLLITLKETIKKFCFFFFLAILIATEVFLSCSSRGTHHMLGQMNMLLWEEGLYGNVSIKPHTLVCVCGGNCNSLKWKKRGRRRSLVSEELLLSRQTLFLPSSPFEPTWYISHSLNGKRLKIHSASFACWSNM